nr:hypothetical protein [Desulfobacterales bacterium]
MDVRRILLIECVHLVSGYFLETQLLEGIKSGDDGVNEVIKVLQRLSKVQAHDRTILVRFRGFTTGPKSSAKLDYVVICGNVYVDSAIANAMIRRRVFASHILGSVGKGL